MSKLLIKLRHAPDDEIADVTGGRAWEIESTAGLGEAFLEIQHRTRRSRREMRAVAEEVLGSQVKEGS